MFSRPWLLLLVVLLAVALAAPGPASVAAPETRHVVKPGDTLWAIAARYDGDPREAVWRIRERNGLRASKLSPGQVLYLPP